MTVAEQIDWGVEDIRRGRNKLIRAWRMGGFATSGSLATITLSQAIDDLTGLLEELQKAKAGLVSNTPDEFRRAS